MLKNLGENISSKEVQFKLKTKTGFKAGFIR